MNKNKILEAGWIKDTFTAGNLQAEVNWTGYEALTGLALIAGIIIALITMKTRKKLAYCVIFASSMAWILINMLIFTPRIEKISQNALIEFCKDRAGEDCYVETLGMKSYAHLFYTRKQIPLNENSYNQEWLLTGEIDKPAYFIIRNKSAAKYRELYPDLKTYEEKNGYVFLKRDIK
jgi:hypothetical protein